MCDSLWQTKEKFTPLVKWTKDKEIVVGLYILADFTLSNILRTKSFPCGTPCYLGSCQSSSLSLFATKVTHVFIIHSNAVSYKG